jgi:hypothetical protein
MEVVLLKVDDALTVGRHDGRVLDVPLERHLPIEYGAATRNLPQCEGNMPTDQAKRLPHAPTRDAPTDRVELSGELVQFATRVQR